MPRTKTRGLSFRRLLALGLFAMLALLVTKPATAQTRPRVERQAWSRTGPAAPLTPQAGNVYVSVVAGQEQARAYLDLDTAGSSETSLTASTIVLGQASDSMMSDQAALAACTLTSSLTADGEISGTAPTTDCSVRRPLQRGTGGAWSLPLDVFARSLVTGSAQGVVILPESGSSTFTVSLAKSSTRVDSPPSTAAAPTPPPTATPSPAPTETRSQPAPVVDYGFPPPEPLGASVALPAASNPAVYPLPPKPVDPSPTPPSERAVALPIAPSRAAVSSATTPVALILAVPIALAAVGLWARRKWLPPVLFPNRAVSAGTVTQTSVWALGIALVLLAGETTAYKLGFIAIVFIAAIGLHILVNWSGELSLAHAGFIGLPAFAVAQMSAHSGASPILFLPVGVVVGALLGFVVAGAALRARGLQVALVTLAVGIAIGRFFFVRTWVIGPSGGLHIPVPSLFGVRFETSRSLVPVLLAVVLLAVWAGRAILQSKVGRALSLVRANPDAAAAAGIPVAYYRGIVYALAGAFAGLAGGAYVFWVQRVSPRAFPLDLGFTYLVIAVLAGRGGLVGLALSAVLLEGGRLFNILPEDLSLYLGPIALIFNVTRYQEGFNGLLRETRERLARRREVDVMAPVRRTIRGSAIRLPVVVAAVVVVAGFAALTAGWYRAGNTDQLWIQNQAIVSGGLGGLGLIILGSMLLVRDALLNGRAAAPQAADEAAEPDLELR